ncbi:MAG TPA: SRPBCC family protein [Pseudonocardiaceae bacterium]|jgi:uncharacterized protein YndB with AHSA1/START domain|nr:SRPBCC family protein [Pseudonocardiaceae bacterium]
MTATATVTLPSDEQILITREFDAPKHLVYRAWTTPDLMRRWWAGRRGTVTAIEMDVRPGGAWRFVMTAHGGSEVAFHGEYREAVPNERLVYTEVFEGGPDVDPTVTTVTFTEVDGCTTVRLLTDTGSKTVRDMILGSGMEVGLQEQMAIIDEIVASLL